MFCVIATIRGKRPEVYGPFGNVMEAHDYARTHQDETGQPCELRPLNTPIVYGEEGL